MKVQALIPTSLSNEEYPILEAYQFENKVGEDRRPEWIKQAHKDGRIEYSRSKNILIVINQTNEVPVRIGDWIFEKDNGEFLVMPDAVFKLWYKTLA